MKDIAPSLSVLIPARNSASTLERALDSVLSQTLLPEKIIVVDDRSDDNTLDIIQSYVQKHPGLFVVVRGPGKGAGAARQAGLKAVETDYVALLDSDDWYTPRALETLNRYVDETGAACGALCKVYADGTRRVQKMPNGKNHLITHNVAKKAIFTSMSSVMYKTDLLRRVSGFNENLVRMEDLDLHLRVTRATSYRFVPVVLAYYTAPNPLSLRSKAFTYAKWEAIVWRRHGFFRWDAFLHALVYSVINILLVPVNLVRRVTQTHRKLFDDVYLRMLLGYLAGLMSQYPIHGNPDDGAESVD
ncbi:MAG: glycosyltransferase family 2 protein [Candidatus Thorarchaeota archaeon]|jgi:glycosyltransferase involved in cell wall biosynthesis